MEINKFYNKDALEGLKELETESINCIVTSPPYYKQLSYESNFNSYLQYIDYMTKIARESFRVLKKEGYFFLNFANDKTNPIKSYEVLQKFLDVGFTLHDTIIWYRYNSQPCNTDRQLTPQYEFIFMMCKYPGNYHLNKEELRKHYPDAFETKNIGNVWRIAFNSGKDKKISMKKRDEDASNGLWGHSGFPIHIASMPILLTTKENDLVLDMFMGSGTTAMACVKHNRNFIGFDINEEYCKFSRERISPSLINNNSPQNNRHATDKKQHLSSMDGSSTEYGVNFQQQEEKSVDTSSSLINKNVPQETKELNNSKSIKLNGENAKNE